MPRLLTFTLYCNRCKMILLANLWPGPWQVENANRKVSSHFENFFVKNFAPMIMAASIAFELLIVVYFNKCKIFHQLRLPTQSITIHRKFLVLAKIQLNLMRSLLFMKNICFCPNHGSLSRLWSKQRFASFATGSSCRNNCLLPPHLRLPLLL